MNPPGLFVRSMRSRVAPASMREVIVLARSTWNCSMLGSSKDPTKSYQHSIIASGNVAQLTTPVIPSGRTYETMKLAFVFAAGNDG